MLILSMRRNISLKRIQLIEMQPRVACHLFSNGVATEARGATSPPEIFQAFSWKILCSVKHCSFPEL